MSRIFSLFIVCTVWCVLAGCTKDGPTKATVTKFYLTKVTLPGDLEDRILFVDDTTLSQIGIYYQGLLIKTNKFQWNNDQSLICFSYVHDDLVESRKLDYANGLPSRLTISTVSTQGITSNRTYYFYADAQNRLDSYEYDELGTYTYLRILQQGKVTWRTDGLNVLVKDGPFQDTSTFKVRSIGLTDTSPWLKLSGEMTATMLVDQLHLVHFFISNKITNLGAYTYDQYTTDTDNNLISIRRTSSQNGFVDFYKFSWKKITK